MSDSVVLWRMCIVWDRTRLIVIFAGIMTFLNTLFPLLSVLAPRCFGFYDALPTTPMLQEKSVYGSQNVASSVAAFMSLSCNVCATALVGLRVW